MATKLRQLTLLCAIAAAPCLLASPVDLTITDPILSVHPGDTVTFSGTFNNNTPDTMDETTTFANFASYDPTILDINSLLGGVPFTVASGDTSPTLDFFTVTISPTATPGSYTADVFLEDGASVPGYVGDAVTVTLNVAAAVPEPGSLELIAGGACLLGLIRRRR